MAILNANPHATAVAMPKGKKKMITSNMYQEKSEGLEKR
jgi:hypothetical protein